jgi:hypothetical protein
MVLELQTMENSILLVFFNLQYLQKSVGDEPS